MATIHAEFKNRMKDLLFSVDTNMTLFKTKTTAYYNKLLTAIHLLDGATDGKWQDSMRALQPLTIHEDAIARAFNTLVGTLSQHEREDLRRTFELKENPTPFVAAKKILGQSFGLVGNRNTRNANRSTHKNIVWSIPPSLIPSYQRLLD